jgi:hypothetical protein
MRTRPISTRCSRHAGRSCSFHCWPRRRRWPPRPRRPPPQRWVIVFHVLADYLLETGRKGRAQEERTPGGGGGRGRTSARRRRSCSSRGEGKESSVVFFVVFLQG